MTTLRAYFCVVTLALSLPTVTHGFSTEEHTWISDSALCVALAYVQEENAQRTWKDKFTESRATAALRVLDSLRPKFGPIGYGELSARPDFVNRAAGYRDQALVDLQEFREKTPDLVLRITELLRNGHHFRLEALREYAQLHDFAVASARAPARDRLIEIELADALFINAYADHFLNDFFAPGHSTEATSNKSHMLSNRVHDLHNRAGRHFLMSVEAKAAFESIIEMAAPRLESCMPSVLLSVQTFSAFVQNESTSGMSSPDGWRSILLVGDGDLYSANSGLTESRAEQAMLLMLSSSVSILEVVRAFIVGDADGSREFLVGSNRLFKSGWCGEVVPLSDTPHRREGPGDACYFVADEGSAREGVTYFAGNAVGDFISAKPHVWEALTWPLLGGSLDLQRLNGQSRLQITPELVFPVYSFGDSASVELGTGYSYLAKASLAGSLGHGPDLRLYLHLKGIGLLGSLEWGYRFHERNEFRQSSNRLGGRLGFGNGLIFGFISAARDAALDRTGRESHHVSWGGGVQVFLPSSLALRWLPAWGAPD